jgi:hypothetical protein
VTRMNARPSERSRRASCRGTENGRGWGGGGVQAAKSAQGINRCGQDESKAQRTQQACRLQECRKLGGEGGGSKLSTRHPHSSPR